MAKENYDLELMQEMIVWAKNMLRNQSTRREHYMVASYSKYYSKKAEEGYNIFVLPLDTLKQIFILKLLNPGRSSKDIWHYYYKKYVDRPPVTSEYLHSILPDLKERFLFPDVDFSSFCKLRGYFLKSIIINNTEFGDYMFNKLKKDHVKRPTSAVDDVKEAYALCDYIDDKKITFEDFLNNANEDFAEYKKLCDKLEKKKRETEQVVKLIEEKNESRQLEIKKSKKKIKKGDQTADFMENVVPKR